VNLSDRFSFDQLEKCARRELGQRRRVYRGLVLRGVMSEATAEREIAMMAAIADFLETQSQPKLL
jgi:hypothetical protein